MQYSTARNSAVSSQASLEGLLNRLPAHMAGTAQPSKFQEQPTLQQRPHAVQPEPTGLRRSGQQHMHTW